MKTIFKVLNPTDGSYVDCDDEQLAIEQAKSTAWAFYLLHTHDAPISKVTTTEEGHEIWQGSNIE
jgi:hypothetical protein